MRLARDHEAELTLRGIGLGAVITVVFTSANIYLGLKTGITFSSSIPAAVISMGLLKLVGGGILENNIVQTQASAAGTLCNVNLVLPGLVLIDYWHGFPLWQTMALCLLGGLFGVVFSVPLRRLMVVDSDLPFPEGVAAAEVLLSGHRSDENEAGGGGLRDLGAGAAEAGLFGMLTTGLRLLPDHIDGVFTLGGSVFRLDGGLSLALVGIGYLVRIGCCLALLIGILITWGIAVPLLTRSHPSGDPKAAAELVWAAKVRLIGAGLIAVAGLWTVVTLVKPMVDAIRGGWSMGSTERRSGTFPPDIPMAWVGIALAILLIPLAVLFWNFAAASGIGVSLAVLVPALTVSTALFGFLLATACGYLAGLLGSSSSPISGIGILAVMLVAGCGLAVLPGATSGDARLIGALTLFVTSLLITASSIANDNLQDLKAGQLVGATPWKQQAALAIGVVLGAVTVAPVLELLYNAYGFPGVLPRSGMDPRNALPAPQAALLAQIADGIVHHRLDWSMVAVGAILGAVFVALEAALRRRGVTLPALSVGIGMYLPCSAVLTIAIGGVVGWLTERAAAPSGEGVLRSLRRRGVLLSSGFLVGESLIGIAIAFSDLLQARSNSLALSAGVPPVAREVAAILIFTGLIALFYRATARGRPA